MIKLRCIAGLVLILLLTASCKYSIGYQITSLDEFNDPNMPELWRAGVRDGCRAGLDRKKFPAMIRDNAGFYINSDLYTSSQDYRLAYNSGLLYCALKGGYSQRSFTQNNMLGFRGDGIGFKI